MEAYIPVVASCYEDCIDATTLGMFQSELLAVHAIFEHLLDNCLIQEDDECYQSGESEESEEEETTFNIPDFLLQEFIKAKEVENQKPKQKKGGKKGRRQEEEEEDDPAERSERIIRRIYNRYENCDDQQVTITLGKFVLNTSTHPSEGVILM